jgi:EAL domain-containing protein (putative c-di-GMP-specific phosphodiesterase class I)
VRGIDRDEARQSAVLSLVSVALSLGMEVVAEGIETAAERDTVIALGCTCVQGFALARPGPPFPESRWD